jgi:raffinose/stachyose/melibiose transport system substrate-binding protein
MIKKLYSLLAVVLISAFVLAACGAPATPETVTVVQTQVVEKIVEVTPTPAPKAEGGNELIVWWSHWANEPAKKVVIEQIVKDYETEHPNVDIVLTWWDKDPLRNAVRSTMTAGGEGAPDITTFDSEVVEWVEAGWMMDLASAIPWDNLYPMAKNDATYPDQGYPGNYKLNLSKTTNMLFYNKDIFAELGITVPENYQFTQTEFLDVVKKCSAGGYAGVADAIGNRKYAGIYPAQYALFSLVGPQEFNLYNSGKKAWDSPEAKSVLDYTVAQRDAGLWPESYSTMTIDEFHVYFHTQRKACMLFVPTWYTGRAFKAVKDGGQDPAWQFGMLRYPAMDGGKANDLVWGGTESGYGVLSTTKHPETSKDILAYVAQPKYGALWTAVTNSPSMIKYDAVKDAPSAETLKAAGVTSGLWDWYWAEYNKVYGSLEVGLAPTARCGDFNAAVEAALADGLPQKLVTVDEAIATINAALCK